MFISRFPRRGWRTIATISLALLVPTADGWARGGLQWGYEPPSGDPLWNIWLVTNPWAALSGIGIPQHDPGPPDLNMGPQPRPYFGTPGTPNSPSTTLYNGPTYGRPSKPARTRYVAPVYPIPEKAYNTERRFQPPYYQAYNGYWHHGYWGGGQWGWERWDDDFRLWSFPRWAIPGLYFPSGYGRYRNPFASGDGAFPNYSVPIEIGDDAAGSSSRSPTKESVEKSAEEALEEARRDLIKSPQATAGLKSFEAARAAFREKNFDLALQKADDALRQLPRDPALHEFRGLVLFARGEYRASAATIYAVLSVSPGWDWTTLSGMYASNEDYTAQLRALETYRKQHPESAEAAFLSAYHYATCRHNESAVKQLRNVARLLPDDDFVPHLLTLLSGSDEIAPNKPTTVSAQASAGSRQTPALLPAQRATVSPSDKAPAADAPAPLDPKTFLGTWRAQRGDANIELTLGEDGKYVWVATRAGRTHRFEGSHRMVMNQLELLGQRGTMLGFVTPRDGGGFEFRLIENDPPAEGLEFGR